MRASVTYLPSSISPMVSSMVSIEMSVRKPSRPWFTPTSATSKGASVRAMLSMVPSPPMTIARSASLPDSSSGSTSRLLRTTCAAVSGSSSTRTPRPWRKRAKLEQRLGDLGALVLADQGDGLERGGHAPHYRREAAGPLATAGLQLHAMPNNVPERLIGYNAIHAERTRTDSAEDAGRALYRRRPAGRLARAVEVLRPGPVPRQHPQRHGGPGGDGLRGEPAHFRRPRADAARLSLLRRHSADQSGRWTRSRSTSSKASCSRTTRRSWCSPPRTCCRT